MKKYYVATFEYEFENENDLVYFAYCIPYTYTMLLSYLRDLSANQKSIHHKGLFLSNKILSNFKENKYMKITKLCTTLSGIDVPLLTITDFDDNKSLLEERKLVIISGCSNLSI